MVFQVMERGQFGLQSSFLVLAVCTNGVKLTRASASDAQTGLSEV